MEQNSEDFRRLRDFLDAEVARINNVGFIANDPVQFPRRFERLQDVELVSFLSATIAWGNRKMICNNCEKMLAMMDNSPLEYVMDEAYEEIPDELNIHRTFFVRDFKYMLRGFRKIIGQYGSLHDFAARHAVGDSEAPAWHLVELMQQQFASANGGVPNSRCLPSNLATTALKRINMALRWLVRDDGIVDMGLWTCIKPSQLFIPLDVHVGDTARALHMVQRRANDRRTVMELTDVLRMMRPADPVVYDFALFGIGIGDKYVGVAAESSQL